MAGDEKIRGVTSNTHSFTVWRAKLSGHDRLASNRRNRSREALASSNKNNRLNAGQYDLFSKTGI